MIRPRGNSWQVDVVINGKRMRRSVSTYTEANELELELKLQLSQKPIKQPSTSSRVISQHKAKEQLPDRPPTMEDMLELTWLRSWLHTKTGSGSKRRSQHVLIDMGWLNMKPSEITKRHFLNLIDFYQKKGNSLATINRKIVSITKLLNTAIDEELINFKPSIRLFKENNSRTRFITCMEEEAILFWLRKLRYDEAWHLARFLVDTGCRLGEALSLRPQNINRKIKSVLFENTKNSMPRKIPLTERALASALQWGQLNGLGFYNRFIQARKHVGLGVDVTPHTLRHTCASRLAQSGVPMAIIKVWLGHKSIRMTDRYAHLNDSNLIVARNALVYFNDK
ncbi:tyrosine-type recombinase/integrase [Aeromonas veronii]|uniref:tyrosine-type recombinase/integrase n=1 Tax=Aeromonas veronii TaxID=654 RepID=UPI003D215F7B